MYSMCPSPVYNHSHDEFVQCLDLLSCYYDGMNEECVTIVGGDFNIVITRLQIKKISL